MRTSLLQDLYTRTGPFVTLTVEVGRTTEDARQQLDARWTSIRHRLEQEGVDDDLVETIGERLQEPPGVAGEVRRTVVAADGEVVLDQLQVGHASGPEVVDVAPLPDLSAWLAVADRQHPFALAVVDREGADIGFHPGLSAQEHDEVTVQGDDFYITKVAEGDWAQKQFQQTAENTWAKNARDVADEIRSGLRSHRAEVVVLAGDERARHLVAEALDGVQVPLVHAESGGRAAGASQSALWDEVRRIVAGLEAHADHETIERLEAASGQSEAAASGLDEVLAALVRGQVERLVLDPAKLQDETVDPADHPGLAVPETAAGPQPADRVLVAAAAATNAEITLLPAEQVGGSAVSALLRWDDDAPATEV